MVAAMDSLGFVTRGILIGFVVSAPIGPVALLCVQRTLKYGARFGISTGLGAAVADLTYITFGLFCMGTVGTILKTYDAWLHCIGGLYLGGLAAVLAVKLKYGPRSVRDPVADTRFWRGGIEGFLLASTNPTNIVGVLATVFAFSNVQEQSGPLLLQLLGAGVAATSWWIGLNLTLNRLRLGMTEGALMAVNSFTIAVIGMLAIWSLIHGISRL